MSAILKMICLIIAAASAPSYPNEIAAKRFIDRIDFLTEFYFDQDVRAFASHKNAQFRETYLMSATTEFEAMAVSLDSAFHIGILYNNYLGMGRQSAAILFDPQEARYALTPLFEYRRKNIFYQTGLDHRCFHQIDRKDRPISPYWNQAYVKVSSANYRFKQMKRYYIGEKRDGYLDNLKWQVWAGYFIREIGGMDKTLLSGGHPWGATAGADAGYSFYKTKSWIFSGHNKIVLFNDTTNTPYWAGELGVDADVYNRQYAVGFFIIYNYEFPRTPLLFSKDRLLELGLRFRL
jgi:hypothetical protein